MIKVSGVPRNFFSEGGGSTNSVEDRRQRERGSGGGTVLTFPLIATKPIACAGNVRGVSGMSFHEDPCNRRGDRA